MAADTVTELFHCLAVTTLQRGAHVHHQLQLTPVFCGIFITALEEARTVSASSHNIAKRCTCTSPVTANSSVLWYIYYNTKGSENSFSWQSQHREELHMYVTYYG